MFNTTGTPTPNAISYSLEINPGQPPSVGPFFDTKEWTSFQFRTLGTARATINSTGIVLPTQHKISFATDPSNTYIGANTDFPEDLEIHADQDVIISPDNKLIVTTDLSASGVITGDGRGLYNVPQDITWDGQTGFLNLRGNQY